MALGTLSAIGLGVAGLGGIVSGAAKLSSDARAAMIQDQNLQNWAAIAIPDPAQRQIALQQFVSQGTIVPQLQTAIQQSPTQFAKIVTDAGTKAAQNKALSSLEQIGDQGGLRLQDKAALQEAQITNAAKANGAAQGIAANAEQRGVGGSGVEIAAQLSNQQGAADRNAIAGTQIAANAQDRALQAIEGAGTQATAMHAQDYNEQQAQASAQDRINQFNTTNLQSVGNANVAANNQAQLTNLAQAQGISNANTNLNNQQQIYNKNLTQQQFEDQVTKANGMNGAATSSANAGTGYGTDLSNTVSNISGAGANMFAVAAASNAKKQALKDQYDYLNKYLSGGNSGTTDSSVSIGVGN